MDNRNRTVMASSVWDPHLFRMDLDQDPAQNLKSDLDLDSRCQSNSDPCGPADLLSFIFIV